MTSLTATEIIKALDLSPHPEGGFFRETFRDAPGPDGRAVSTAIYFLLNAGERSHWHRVDAVETWHWYAGAPMRLSMADTEGNVQSVILGNDLTNDQTPQYIIEKHQWQSALSLGNWTLVGCTVAPGFQFEGFELAPENWSPGLGSR
jgi:hypothetical protein